jgi:hypothetical protein
VNPSISKRQRCQGCIDFRSLAIAIAPSCQMVLFQKFKDVKVKLTFGASAIAVTPYFLIEILPIIKDVKVV